jgi:nicotinate-nucleotide adenylyltransferase
MRALRRDGECHAREEMGLDRVLLFGGSFDPVHFGHLIVGRFVAEALGIERVVLMPGASPPHKLERQLAPVAERLAMCRLAVEGDPQFEVSDWELGQSGPNYTLLTIRHFREFMPAQTRIYWLVGMDSLVELATWYRVGELVEECTIVTAARPGYDDPDLSRLRGALSEKQIEALRGNIMESPRIDISATDIRARVRAGGSIRYLVPDAVARHIAERGLYRT